MLGYGNFLSFNHIKEKPRIILGVKHHAMSQVGIWVSYP